MSIRRRYFRTGWGVGVDTVVVVEVATLAVATCMRERYSLREIFEEGIEEAVICLGLNTSGKVLG